MTWTFWHRRTHRYFHSHSAGGRTLLPIKASNLFSYFSRKHAAVKKPHKRVLHSALYWKIPLVYKRQAYQYFRHIFLITTFY